MHIKRQSQSIWQNIALCIAFIWLLSGCSLAGFGGMTLQEPQTAAGGIAAGLSVLEAEIGGLSFIEEARIHYNVNARIPLSDWKLFNTADDSQPEKKEALWPYLIGGVGGVDEQFSWNAGTGMNIVCWQQGDYYLTLRLGYRHFFVHGEDDVDRVIIGPELFIFNGFLP